MSLAKKLIIALVGLYLVALASAFLLPKNTIVVRNIELSASKERVFELVSEHKKFITWSPWAQKDPNIVHRYEGPDIGIGSKQYWTSEHAQVGNGFSEYIAYEPYSHAAIRLAFDQGGGDAFFDISSNENGLVRLSWTFKSDHKNVFERIIGYFFLEGMLAPDFESGLKRLKALAEAEREPVIQSREITYYDDETDTQLKGYLAIPKNHEKAPVVIVVHEWWGHNEYARQRADMLAELGYNAFAIDMYGEGKVASHPEDAKTFMGEVVSNASVLHSRFDSALKYIQDDDALRDKPVAAIGYCFGGAVVLSMARSNKNLAGVVSFHGALGGLVPIQDNASVPSLVLNGAADPFITKKQIDAFKAEMTDAGLQYEFINYPDAMHGFTSKAANEYGKKFNLPLAYNKDADLDSWEKMHQFLTNNFKKQ